MNGWPKSLFPGKIRFNRLSLELTKKCTNKCAHCANWGDPQDGRMMDTQLVFRLIREAKEQDLKAIHLWGGEPFLHPDLDQIVAEVFRNNLHLMIATNGFWGRSLPEAAAKIAAINGLKPEELFFRFILSCDKFHQSQPATPLNNVANIAQAVIDLNNDHFTALAHGCNLVTDRTLDGLLPLLSPRQTLSPRQQAILDSGYSVHFHHKREEPLLSLMNGPVDLSVGRAKTLAPELRASPALEKDEVYCQPEPITHDTLYADVAGAVFVNSHNIGDKIFPLGSLARGSLAGIIKEANRDLLVKALYTLPYKYFLFPFRKYLDLNSLLARSHSAYELFNYLYLAEASRDKREELRNARAALQAGGKLNPESLLTIRQYGDVTDRELLSRLFTDRRYSLEKRWQAAFVYLAISIETDGYFAYSGYRSGGLFGNPDAPMIHSYLGEGAVKELGSCLFPAWYENFEY
jgi:hypothetical protein